MGKARKKHGHAQGMDSRGAARPMVGAAEDGHDDGHKSGGDHGAPYSAARRAMLDKHHEQTLWIPWTLFVLGVWTALAPFNFGYLNESLWVDPSGGRGVWFSEASHTALRARLISASDMVSGVLLVVLAWRSLRAGRPVSRWLACSVGAWMNAAPILLWSPSVAGYANGTLVGMLVIALTILVPGMPNMILYMKMGPPVPPGWSYNPSSWPQRWILIATGFLGLLASRYLAMYQLGYLERIWDPFFGAGSRRVLDSRMSHSWPISDAGLGALAYTFEFLMGYMGGPSRWRTMPWMVTLFGILVIPLGLVHIVLVIAQPVVVGSWCTFCLVAAAIMLPMIPLEVDEVIAMGQHLGRSKRAGAGLWKSFWKGGPADAESRPDERTPELARLPERPVAVLGASLWGLSVPWTLALSAGLGIALMAMPALFGVGKPSASVFHLGGSLAVVVSVISFGEVLRAMRYMNVPLGLAVASLPWLLEGSALAPKLLGSSVGLAIALLALPRGPVRERYGSWDRFIR